MDEKLGSPWALLRRQLRKDYPVAVRGKGPWIYAADGRRYLDLAGSAAVSFIGHGDREIAAAIGEQLAELEFVHSSLFLTDVAEAFARELLEFAGPAFEGGAVFFTSGGSKAIESALKLARQYQVEIAHSRRTKILARNHAYHGATFGAMAVSGNRTRREIYLAMVPECPRVNTPYCYRCTYGCEDCASQYAAEVARALEKEGDKIAAFIFEPMSGATLGAVEPPDGYLQAVIKLCREHGVLTIADEVMTGFGRTGRNFACDHWGLAPDLLVVAKGISSGYAPLGAVIANRRVVDAITTGSGTLVHGLTYNAHPVAAAAGRAVLAKIRAQALVNAADSNIAGTVGSLFKGAMRSLVDCESVGDVRGKGMLWGIEFVRDRESKAPFETQVQFAIRVSEAAMRHGIVLYPMQGCVDGIAGDHLLMAPPAIINEEEISWAAQQLHDSIEEVQRAIGR